jgi:hypothetical protein
MKESIFAIDISDNEFPWDEGVAFKTIDRPRPFSAENP